MNGEERRVTGLVAVVTGANQGLGFALVQGLCARLGSDDVVYLTARNEERGRAAVAQIGVGAPQLKFERLDVADA
ncbi:MAG: SDR family NAD(P)-dependent oxidoreductase, partial [Myxococcota bacterium]